MGRWVRTFVAVEASGDACGRAVKLCDRLQATSANVRWTAPPLHFTLKFLGDVDILQIPDVCDAVIEAVADIPAFDLEIHGAGAFPTDSQPRTVWIGTRRGTEQMIDLHDQIDRKLNELGFRSENRRFRPHLTIGRVRRSPTGIEELGEAILAEADFQGGIMRVDEVQVFSSGLERSGPVYEVLGHAELW